MKKIRFRVIILILWFISFYLFDRLLDPIAFSNLAIVLVIAVASIQYSLPAPIGCSKMG